MIREFLTVGSVLWALAGVSMLVLPSIPAFIVCLVAAGIFTKPAQRAIAKPFNKADLPIPAKIGLAFVLCAVAGAVIETPTARTTETVSRTETQVSEDATPKPIKNNKEAGPKPSTDEDGGVKAVKEYIEKQAQSLKAKNVEFKKWFPAVPSRLDKDDSPCWGVRAVFVVHHADNSAEEINAYFHIQNLQVVEVTQ